MLRRGVGVTLAECSYVVRSDRVVAARICLRTRATGSPLIIRPSHKIAPFNPKHAVTRSFATTSIKGKEKEIDSAEKEDDPIIVLLGSFMKKREILRRREDSTSNVDIAKAISELDELGRLWEEWKSINKSITNLLRLSSPETEPDEEMRKMALEEASSTLESLDNLKEQIRIALLPHNPLDDASAIVEVRTGIGGEESALFVGEISRMYTKFCENFLHQETGQASFQVERINAIPTDSFSSFDAFREVILQIKGKGAYKLLQNEAGIHRVQRIPLTTNTKKLQSSTIAVLVLPGGNANGNEDPDSSEVKDDIVDPKDVKVEVMRSRGAGGQHVNKTESAVRLTHEPSGITVSMQDSRSQHQNRTKAWAVLRARLRDRQLRQQEANNRNQRRVQMGGMERGDRIRTYNFPQDRVTDHRIPINCNGITQIMDGESEGGLNYLIDSVRQYQEQLTLQDLQQQINDQIVHLERA